MSVLDAINRRFGVYNGLVPYCSCSGLAFTLILSFPLSTLVASSFIFAAGFDMFQIAFLLFPLSEIFFSPPLWDPYRHRLLLGSPFP